MNKRVILSISFAMMILPARGVKANHYQCPARDKPVNTAIMFANGMLTNEQSALNTLKVLKPLVIEKLRADPETIIFGAATNFEESFWVQLWKVTKQRLAANPSQLIRIVAGVVPAPDWFSEELVKIAAEIDLSVMVKERNLSNQIQLYREQLNRGRRVLVIAHSQGNLYSNTAYRRLFEVANAPYSGNNFRIVSVANPSNTVAGESPDACGVLGCYTTYELDLVIEALLALPLEFGLGNTLPPNVFGTGSKKPRDALGHGIVETYLHLDNTREQILNHVAAQVGAFEEQKAVASDGMITATLEWDSAADLDLHVFERDERDHVYWAYPSSGVGHLDLDNQDGFGPEHYYAECGYAEDGLYQFAVGYYEGEGPVTARLYVQAGDIARSFSVEIDEPQGRASITDPVPVAYLRVLNDSFWGVDLQLAGDLEALED
ncbi:MAG: hypothetical protein JXA30_11820 [Deltaproteobacteria bacterium]|nr:hypothetical protein [Deltaproteobacteria bacterium]